MRNGFGSPQHADSPWEGNQSYLPAASAATAVPLWRWWYLDFIAIATALATLAAIVGILAAYDGQVQEVWPSDVLTINGLVAILATICRGAFMASVASVLSQEKWNRFSDYSGTSTETATDKPRYRKLEDFAVLDEASRGSWGSLRLLWRFKIA